MSPDGASRTAEVEAKVVISATGAWADELRGELGQDEAPAQDPRQPPHVPRRSPAAARGGEPPPSARSARGVRDPVGGRDHPRHDRRRSRRPRRRAGDQPGRDASTCSRPRRRRSRRSSSPRRTSSRRASGVRPVIDTGKSDPSKESREHAIWKEDGLLTISGGKLTTFVVMARDALARRRGGARRARPAHAHLRRGPGRGRRGPRRSTRRRACGSLGRFGSEITDLVAAEELARAIPGSIALWSELRIAARSEAVVTLSDLLLRRVRLGLLLPNAGLDSDRRDQSDRAARARLGRREVGRRARAITAAPGRTATPRRPASRRGQRAGTPAREGASRISTAFQLFFDPA